MYVRQNLAKYANYLNNDEQPIEFWDGCCHIHHNLTTGEVTQNLCIRMLKYYFTLRQD